MGRRILNVMSSFYKQQTSYKVATVRYNQWDIYGLHIASHLFDG